MSRPVYVLLVFSCHVVWPFVLFVPDLLAILIPPMDVITPQAPVAHMYGLLASSYPTVDIIRVLHQCFALTMELIVPWYTYPLHDTVPSSTIFRGMPVSHENITHRYIVMFPWP